MPRIAPVAQQVFNKYVLNEGINEWSVRVERAGQRELGKIGMGCILPGRTEIIRRGN